MEVDDICSGIHQKLHDSGNQFKRESGKPGGEGDLSKFLKVVHRLWLSQFAFSGAVGSRAAG